MICLCNMKFIILLFACFVPCIQSNKKYLRIYGGRNATESEFPFVVKMMFQKSMKEEPSINNLICTCSVLTQRWTLTAAHCVTTAKRKIALIKVSAMEATIVIEYQTSPKSESTYSKVLYMISHPSYYSDKPGINDIGLLKTEPVLVSNYGKLSSLDYTTLSGQEVVIVGYGMINRTSLAPIPHVPQVLEAIVKKCYPAKSYPVICYALPCSTQTNIARTICSGDSGGPTIHASGIVAVSSMTKKRECEKYMKGKNYRRELYHKGYNSGLSIPISSFIDWIYNIVKSEAI